MWGGGGGGIAYVGFFGGLAVLENVPENINRRVWLDGDACLHAVLVDISNQLLRGRLSV